jgi:hypothetical protein
VVGLVIYKEGVRFLKCELGEERVLPVYVANRVFSYQGFISSGDVKGADARVRLEKLSLTS